MRHYSNCNTKLPDSFAIYKRSFCSRRKNHGRLRRTKTALFTTSANFRGENKKKNRNHEERTPKLAATCPFSDAGGTLAAEIQSNLQSFRALGRTLVPGLLASKQRLHGLQRVTPGVDKKAPRRGRRRGCPNSGTCLYLRLGYILSRRRVCGGKVSGRKDRVMWTKGGVLWKINVVIEEKRVGERKRERKTDRNRGQGSFMSGHVFNIPRVGGAAAWLRQRV